MYRQQGQMLLERPAVKPAGSKPFSDFVAGQSIAIVGPAPMLTDQSEKIESHDLVYRPAHSPIGGRRGQRIDIAFFNHHTGRSVYNDDQTELRERCEPATWWVYKPQRWAIGRRDGNWRKSFQPAMQINPNVVTAALFDLMQFQTGPITVYGADLYAAGPGNAYDPSYDRRPLSGQAQGVIGHDPIKQMQMHRACFATGRIVGDDRYVAAVTMSDAEYRAVIQRWKEATQEQPA